MKAKVVENSLPKPVDYRRTPGLNYMVHLNISYRFSRAVEVMAKFGGLSQKYRFKGYIFFLLKNQRDGLAKMDIGIERQGVAVSPRRKLSVLLVRVPSTSKTRRGERGSDRVSQVPTRP